MEIDYRDILKREYEARLELRPQYSLRAFARDLGLSPPHLSTVLAKKRGLSASVAKRISKKLGFSPDEALTFCSSAAALHGRSHAERERAVKRLQRLMDVASFTTLAESQFRIMSDWYHLAILHLVELPDFQSCPKWIATRLSLPESKIGEAISNLERAGLLKSKDGKIQKCTNFVKTEAVPSRAIRRFHRQMIRKADAAVEAQTTAERDFSSTLVCVDRSKLPEIKRWLKEFREEFCGRMESDAPTDVYSLNLHFFCLTNNSITHKESP